MVRLLVSLNWLLPLFYLAVLIDYGARFFLRTKSQNRNVWLIPMLCVHGLFLVLWSLRIGQPPLTEVYEILSVMALLTTGVYAMVEFAGRDRRTGMFVFGLVFLFQYTSSSFLGGTIIAERAVEAAVQSGGWGQLHKIPALAAYTAFAVAAVYGLLHLLARRDLKQHRFGVLFDRLPSLELLGQMSWYALLGGFVFVSVTMITGALLSHGGSAERVLGAKVLAKIIIGSIAWVIYGVAVVGRLWARWASVRISGIAVAGFVVIMMLLIVSGFLS